MQALRAKIKKRFRPGSAAAGTISSRINMDVIEGIQRITATPGCVLHVERLGKTKHSFTKASNIALPGLSHIPPVSEVSLLAVGSFQKSFISVALYLIIEEGLGLEEQDTDVWNIMENAWDKDAFEIFNDLRAKRRERRIVAPMRGFTLKQLLQHESAFPTHQRYLWGPESSFIFSDSSFESTITEMTDMELPEVGRSSRYSSLNYVLAGNIVKLACGAETLADALHSTIFARFDMPNTVVRSTDFSKRAGDIARAVATTIGKPAGFEIPQPEHFHDTASLACGGGYSCVKDMAEVLRWSLQQMMQEGSKMDKLLQSSVIEDENGLFTSTMLGIHAKIDSTTTGSQSYDHQWQKAEYTLGRHEGGSIWAFSKAGAVRGFSCHYYLIPAAQMFFVVMTNSSGILDASNHISQYLLHRLLGIPGEFAIVKHVQRVGRHKLAAIETKIGRGVRGRQRLRDLTQYSGTYVHQQSQVQLVIGEQLGVYLQYKSGQRTKPLVIEIAPDGDLFLLPRPEDDSIETYGSWGGYRLAVCKSSSVVTKLIGIATTDEGERRTVFDREELRLST